MGGSLDAPTALERRSAEKALLDAGPEILQCYLPKINRSAEASERLSQIRSRLQPRVRCSQSLPSKIGSLSGVTTWGAALESLGLDTAIIHPLSDSETIEPISANLTFCMLWIYC